MTVMYYAHIHLVSRSVVTKLHKERLMHEREILVSRSMCLAREISVPRTFTSFTLTGTRSGWETKS